MALTKVLAEEYAPHGICINSMLIGRIKSAQMERFHQQAAPEKSLDEFYEQLAQPIPIKRMGEAEEAANLALFLASPASSYVTGCAINMDGGMCPVP